MEQELSFGRQEQTRRHPRQRAFSGAGSSHDPEGCSFLQSEADLMHGFDGLAFLLKSSGEAPPFH